jgi:2-polyprenyl-3-methyl-5-hydroxy-6-metoxy-1,4-benzoquinol methylase
MTDLFKEKAKDWDMDVLVKGIADGIRSALSENIKMSSDMHVMDFGAGTGLVTELLAKKVAKVCAVDVSKTMLDELMAKQALEGRVETLCQNIVEHPLGREFDLIVSAMAMHHVENTDALLRRFYEHLKPGGQVALADLDEEDGSFHTLGTEGVYHNGFNRDVITQQLLQQGFKEIRFVTAHTVSKSDKQYPIFLVVAHKV